MLAPMIDILAKLVVGIMRNSVMVAMSLFLYYALKMSGRDPREVLAGIDLNSLCPGSHGAADMMGCMAHPESMVNGLDLDSLGLPALGGGGSGQPYYPGGGGGDIFGGGRAGQPYYPGGGGGMFGGSRGGKPYQG